MAGTIEQVVGCRVCVGCGACGVATGGRIPLTLSRHGIKQADLTNADENDRIVGSRVCPFADESQNEDEIAAQAFPDLDGDEMLGRYLSVYAARVADQGYVTGSSSGGLTSWIARRLLELGHVDGVIHVGPSSDEMFSYTVSSTVQEIHAKRKSVYYSTSFDEVLRSVRGDGKRYAFIGVPCFVKAARLVAGQDPVFKEQLAYFIGLVCGHLKSQAFAELLAWQVGVPPERVDRVDFRVKRPGHDAGDYGFGAATHGGPLKTRPNRQLIGANWGHGMMQLNACNYCDDIFAETADVVLGDAWLDEYRKDWRGTNVIVNRNEVIESILEDARESGELEIEPLAPDRAARSQAGNFRHRRDGLSVRLEDDVAEGRWTPKKRVAPGSRKVTEGRKAIVRQRRLISARSHDLFLEAKDRGSLRHFKRSVRPLVATYQKLEFGPLLGTVVARMPWLTRTRLLRGPLLRSLRALAGRLRGTSKPPAP